uniref:Invertase/pectin methylesterase inhibitor family protein n=1 Tax=Solanum tuberosum TaxID=4113 RepID=M0ZLA2_SOLTU
MGSINTNRLMNPRTMTFVETQCRRTRYQELCVRTLSNYVNATSQDPQEIAQVALKVSLAKAINTKYYIMKLQHLRLDGERAFEWHQSNVQTWLSTVLTDAYTCMEGMNNLGHASMGGKMKAMIKAKVLNVAQVTSNALGLFNGFAARHKASHHVGYGKNKP